MMFSCCVARAQHAYSMGWARSVSGRPQCTRASVKRTVHTNIVRTYVSSHLTVHTAVALGDSMWCLTRHVSLDTRRMPSKCIVAPSSRPRHSTSARCSRICRQSICYEQSPHTLHIYRCSTRVQRSPASAAGYCETQARMLSVASANKASALCAKPSRYVVRLPRHAVMWILNTCKRRRMLSVRRRPSVFVAAYATRL
jgi:hypothetical protein